MSTRVDSASQTLIPILGPRQCKHPVLRIARRVTKRMLFAIAMFSRPVTARRYEENGQLVTNHSGRRAKVNELKLLELLPRSMRTLGVPN